MKASISGKVMLIYGSIFLLIISMTFWLSYQGTVGRLESDLTDTNLALLKQVDQKMEVAFRQTEKDLLELMEELEFVYFMLDSYDNEAQKYSNYYGLTTKLKHFINANPNFSSIFVYSAVNGDILTEKAYMNDISQGDNWLDDYMDMPGYFKWLTTHPVWDGTTTKNVVTLIRSYPTLSSPGYRNGMVAVNINEDVIYGMIESVYENSTSGHLFIFDAEGNVVSHDDKTMLYQNRKQLPYMKKVLSADGSGSLSIKLDGVPQTVFYRTSAYTGWKLVSILPESQIYEPLRLTRNLLFVLAGSMIILALAVLFYVNRITFKPLDRLVSKLAGTYQPEHKHRFDTAGFTYLETVFEKMLQDREHLEKHVRDSKAVLKWRIIMDMLTGYRTDYQALRHHLEFTGVRLFPERFLVCTAEINKAEGSLGPRDETLYTYVFCNVAEELMGKENTGAAIDLGGGRAVLLFSFAEGEADQNHLRALAIMELLLDVLKKQFGLIVTVGVGRGVKELKDVQDSYGESRKALRYKLLFGSHSVISIEDVQPPDSQQYYRLNRKAGRIMEALKLADTGKMKEDVHQAFLQAVELGLPPDLIRQFSFDLIVKALQVADSVGIGPEESTDNLNSIYEKIERSEDWKQAEALALSVLDELAAKLMSKRSQRGKNDTIDRMLTYIQSHYQESDFSLDRLAEHFHLSPTYISKQFKEYTERNFIDYLIEIRIDASKALLAGKAMKVNDVAEAVGYMNSRSFLRTFKKYTGMTPTEYRERALSKPPGHDTDQA
ncbi:helix-turn-helix domain-containing protein [Candidatus Pristimantibacillus sp. PTI5]|uniref:helix-turn-helix domain-containing protein n=1 Tax=Candidatus Pristimantibacillus sp. PTI5 TaxID=3400422 RepID=UPI003B0129FF